MITKILKRGMIDQEVITMQTILKAKGFFNSDLIQNFGPKTENAVKAFQTSLGLEANGIVEGSTLDALNGNTTGKQKTINIQSIMNTIKALNYIWYTDRPNIIGIRTEIDVPNVFNDFIFIEYSGEYKIYVITTNPGIYWLEHPENKLGTAVLKPGQYVDSHSIGFHQGKPDHRCLRQTGTLVVYRDNNHDLFSDETGTEDKGTGFGVNIHGAKKVGETIKIGEFSAGCQVFNDWSHKEEFVDICEKYKIVTNNKFTYTLIKEKQIVW